ncbi:MAG: hypothetical protein ACT4PT_09250 [Methanobacteriota archaeon]
MSDRTIVALALIPLLLSGCLGASEPADELTETTLPSEAAPADGAAAAPAPEAPTAATPAEPATPPAPPVPVELAFAWDGALASAARACAPMDGECVETGDMGDHMTDPEFAGSPVGGKLTLTWTPSSPLMESLRFGVVGMIMNDDGTMEHGYANVVDGMSPLEVDLTGMTLAENEMLHVFVWAPSRVPGANVHANSEQAFHVEGAFLVLPGAAGAMHEGH